MLDDLRFLRELVEQVFDGGDLLAGKVAVIDQHWATVGSSNIDPFSLLLAREANVFVLDTTFADELRRSILKAMDGGAHELLPDAWRRLPWPSRLLRWASYNLLRVLVGIAGYGGKGQP